MPFLSNSGLTDDEQQKKQLAEQQGQSTSQNISGVSTSLAPTNGTAGKGVAQSSGRFTNLQSYVDANKEQAADMGTKVASDVSTTADQATGSIDAFKQAAPTEIAAKNEQDLNTDYYGNANANKSDYDGFKASGGSTFSFLGLAIRDLFFFAKRVAS